MNAKLLHKVRHWLAADLAFSYQTYTDARQSDCPSTRLLDVTLHNLERNKVMLTKIDQLIAEREGK